MCSLWMRVFSDISGLPVISLPFATCKGKKEENGG